MKSATRRLFFAFWPEKGVRRAIVERRALLGELTRRRVPDHNLHLTLLFLGDQPADSVEDIQGLAGEIQASPITMTLDRFGWFRGARVAWLGGDASPTTRQLVADLAEAMRGLGLKFDRRPFHPHVTLFRQVRQCPDFPEPPPLTWKPGGFALIESISSRPYQVLRKWSVECGGDGRRD
jgi:RNA 2',3'-cyclic 3'-phosphodiesterase